MDSYVHGCIANIVLLLLSFNKYGWIGAVVELYVFICSNSLYERYLTEQSGCILNSRENSATKCEDATTPAQSTALEIQPLTAPAYSTCEL